MCKISSKLNTQQENHSQKEIDMMIKILLLLKAKHKVMYNTESQRYRAIVNVLTMSGI